MKDESLKGRFIRPLISTTALAFVLAACGSGSSTTSGGGTAANNQFIPTNLGGGPGGTGPTGTIVLMGGSVSQLLRITGTVTLFAGSATGAPGSTNGAGTGALFNGANAITTDGTSLYVADQKNSQIRKIVISTGVVSLLAGSPTGATGTTNGVGSAALFNQPIGITCDGPNLYVADTGNNQIRKIVIATGTVSLLAGSPTGATGNANGSGTAALFNGLNAITTDGTNLFVADYLNNEIRQVIIATGAVTLMAGSAIGTAGLTNATGSAALFNGPGGITTDGTDVYVTDSANNEIRKIAIATGAVTLFAGSATRTAGLTNGTGTGALFSMPHHIATDGANLYVAEISNNDVRQIVISTGAVTTLAGSATGAAGMANGSGSAATFNAPAGVVADGTSLYIGDFGNNQIRKIQ